MFFAKKLQEVWSKTHPYFGEEELDQAVKLLKDQKLLIIFEGYDQAVDKNKVVQHHESFRMDENQNDDRVARGEF